MTAQDVLAALALRWPDSEHLLITEAPQKSDRSGRKLDLLVVSLWRSRGLALDGVEVKVSASDWKRELKNAAKADFWWRHTNRFWVAVPDALVDVVRPDLPPGWGLLSCQPDMAPKVVVRPEYREAEPLPWATCVGVMRAAADCGLTALRRAEERGRSQGYREGKEAAERLSPDGAAKRALDDLRARVEEFERASGLKLDDPWVDAENLGTLVAIVCRELRTPGWTVQRVGGQARVTAEAAERLLKQARETQKIAERVSEALAEAAVPAERS